METRVFAETMAVLAQANPTATPEDMLVFINAVLTDGLAAEEAARVQSQAAAAAATRQAGAMPWQTSLMRLHLTLTSPMAVISSHTLTLPCSWPWKNLAI